MSDFTIFIMNNKYLLFQYMQTTFGPGIWLEKYYEGEKINKCKVNHRVLICQFTYYY